MSICILLSLIRRQIKNIQKCSLRRVSNECDFDVQYHYPWIIKTPPLPMARYGGRHIVTMIPGDGLGPEHSDYVIQVLKHAGAPVDFEIINIDAQRTDDTDLDNAVTAIKRNGVGIKGTIETNCTDTSIKLANVAIRNELDLYAYIIWCKSYPGIRARYSNIDIILVRENTQGEYSMLEHMPRKGVVQSLKIITAEGSQKVADFAFKFAQKNGRKKVTIVHKANIMKLSDGLFLKTCRQVAREYPEIKHNDLIVDNCCMQLVTRPEDFDVIVAPNLYGNVMVNILCGLSGGPGLMSGRNYGDHYAVFETATRNRGVKMIGKDTANPVALLKAAVDMLYHLGHTDHAQKIEKAIYKTIVEDKVYTPDIGGTATTSAMVQNIISKISR